MKNGQELIKKIQSGAIKCLLFDFDGTLYDIKEPLEQAVDEAIKSYHLNADKELLLQEIAALIESIQAHPIPKIILQSHEIFKHITALSDISFLKKLRIATKMFSNFQAKARESTFFPSVEPVIQKLQENCELIIVSHNQTAHIKEHLKKTQLEHYFDEVYGADKLEALKPDPRVFDFFLQKEESYSPKEILYIGDMPTDIQAGNDAGFWTIAIQSGITNRETLWDYGPDLLLNNLHDLLDIIEKKDHLPSQSKMNKAKVRM
jgi:HAD superfamily hydrolase (TIGR01549 family)